MLRLIFALGAVFEWIAGALGEAAVKLFDMVGTSIISACTLEESFTSTYSNLLLNSGTGLFRAVSDGEPSIFPSEDPTNITTAAALGLLFGLVVWQLFKSLFGNYLQAEEPSKILFKGMLYSLIISTYGIWTNAILKLVLSPIYKSFAGTTTTGTIDGSGTDSFFEDLCGAIYDDTGNEASAAIVAAFGGVAFLSVSLIKSIVLLILCFPIGIKFIQLALEIIERFIQMFLVIVFGPLCLACGISPAWAAPAQKWFHIFINGMVGLILNILGIKLSLIAFQNFIYNYAHCYTSIGDMFVQYVAVYAMFKISSEFDNIQNKMGFDTLSAGGLGVALFGGLKAGTSAVFGNGRGNGGLAKNTMAAAGAAGNATAGRIAALNKQGGLLAGAAALGMTLGTRDGRAVLGAAAAKAGIKSTGQVASKKGFAQQMAVRSQTGQKGSLDGGDMKNATGFFNSVNGQGIKGLEGECVSCTTDKNGNVRATMKKADGSTYTATMNANGDIDAMQKTCGAGETAIAVQDANGNTWAMKVPTSELNDSVSKEANAGSGTNGDAANVVAGNDVSTGGMEENQVAQNESGAPIEGNTTFAQYANQEDNGEAAGYAELAVGADGAPIRCDKNGELDENGNYFLGADGTTAVAAAALISDNNGDVVTFSNVGNQLMYNKDDGTIGYMSREAAANGKLPEDFRSFSTDGNQTVGSGVSPIRTASESTSIETGATPSEVICPTAGTNMTADTITSASGDSVSLGDSSYSYNVAMGDSGLVTSASNHQIQAVEDSNRAGMAQTSMVESGDGSGSRQCMAQAQIYSDASCTSVVANTGGAAPDTGFIKVGNNQAMSVAQAKEAGIIDNQGRFAINQNASNVSKSVQMYSKQSDGTYSPLTAAAAISSTAPVYALDSNNSFQQVSKNSIESIATPTKSVGANGATSYSVAGANGSPIEVNSATINPNGTCQTFAKTSSGYVPSASGTYVKGADNNFHQMDTNSSNFSSTVSGTAKKYFVGDIETNQSGAIPLKSSSGSGAGNGASVAQMESVYGQKFNAYRPEAVEGQTSTSGSNQNAINTSNGRGDRFVVAATSVSDSIKTMESRSIDKQESIYTAAFRQSSQLPMGNAVIPKNINQSLSSKDGRTVVDYVTRQKDSSGKPTTSTQRYHVLDANRWASKDGSTPPGVIKSQVNGKDVFMVPEKSASSYKYIDSVINNESKMD